MKTVMNKYRLLAVAAAMMVSISVAPAAQASGGNNKAPFEFKWIGNHDESPVLRLSLNNLTAGEYTIVIKDESKQVLYAEKLKGSNITRLYKLQNQGPELEDANLIFEVTDRSNNTTVIYKVSTAVQMLNATEVTISKNAD